MNKQAFDHSLAFIKSWLQYQYEHQDIPGFVVAISHKGKVVLHEAYGYADLEKKTKMTPGHLFRVASQSKTFTATAIMQLQAADKLRLDDTVVTHLPWLKKHTDPRWQHVTVRQLLCHGAGVLRDGLQANFWQLEGEWPDEATIQRTTLQADLVIDNNVKMKYSNFGYALLGLVIASTAGQPYNEYVTQHIIKPLGLKHTGPEYTPAIKDQLAVAYAARRAGDKVRLPIASPDTRAMAPATGFYADAADLCTYFRAHAVGSGQLLDDESKKEMQRSAFPIYWPGRKDDGAYGLGMSIEKIGKHTGTGHGGAFPGHATRSLHDSERDLTVVVMTNAIDGPARSIKSGIYHVIDYFQDNTSGDSPKHNLRHLEGRYCNLWGTMDFVATGDKAVIADVNSWEPFKYPEELEYIDNTTFKLVNAGSYYSDGEHVRFTIKNGGVQLATYSGTTMWPEAEWNAKQHNRTIIG